MINDVIQLLGIANPQLSRQWTLLNNTNPGFDNSFKLSVGNDNYVAPCAGYLNVNRGLERIILPGGNTPVNGVVIRIDPQVYLRLTRMYSSWIENQPAANTFLTERPVPAYFVYTNVAAQQWTDSQGQTQFGPLEGLVFAGNNLQLQGDLTIHDQYGFPIDPVAVAAAFNAIIRQFATMQQKALNSASGPSPINPPPQLGVIATLGGAAITTIQLINPNGTAVTDGNTRFSNLGALDTTKGYYQVTTPATQIARQAAPQFADSMIAAATNGTFAANYTVRPARAALNLGRDFFRAYVVSLNTYLLGSAPQLTEPSWLHKVPPVVRDNEQITLLVNGNECLGAVNAITAGGPNLALLASQIIDNDFVLPPLPNGAFNERWPAFPAPGANPGSNGAIPANIVNNFTLTAYFIQDGPTQNADVLVSLACPQFANGDSIRIYSRIFHEDGTESRGNGAGAIINGGRAVFRLKDPFSIVNGIGQATPISPNPLLMIDAVLVNRGLQKRMFGNVQCNVTAAAPIAAPDAAALTVLPNVLANLAELGVSPAGISGTSFAQPVNLLANFNAFLTGITGEGQPRNAPRYPTMARNDSMAASFAGGNWQAFCGGTIMKKDALSNFPMFGNPGSPGGKEYSSAGVYTQNGLLAFDIARAAYRRTRNLAQRMAAFMTGANAANWTPPNAPAAGPNNTWAAAALETIASRCETPEIGYAFNDMNSIPDTLGAFVTQIQNLIGLGPLPAWIPGPLQGPIQNAINGIGTDPQNQQAYDDLRREFASSIWGRKDTYWALKDALGNARECIYIQGTFFGHTAYQGDQDLGNDFVEMLKNLIMVSPRLKLIICLGKPIHYGKGYETFEAREYKRRKEVIAYLQGDPDPVTKIPVRANQVLAFHPTGFPMRPKALLHNVVIVDDMWALVGSTSIRRRGLKFDGGQDIVMLDKTITNGKSAGIRNFRIRLMREHLNFENNPPNAMTPALQVRLTHLHEAFDALRELLDSGGAGLISPIWDGDRTEITENTYPSDNLADPDSDNFRADEAALMVLFGALSTTPA